VNLPEARASSDQAPTVDAGVNAPLIGDLTTTAPLLTRHPGCAGSTDRINPGNVGSGRRRDEQFATICKVAADQGKPVRIGGTAAR
jgi:(E)-4-hydroxy-3-methylbut-2-enyl-diphosphate synthase